MTDKPSHVKGGTRSPTSQLSAQAFDFFVGFIYAMTIALVIETAYLRSHFTSIAPAVLTMLLLAFFAYDWHSRYSPRRAMSGATHETRTAMFFRRLLEIGIVYFLLLVCLKLVEVWTPKDPPQDDPSRTVAALFYSMTAFAVASGIWNALMIRVSTQVNKNHISSLLKGHLHDDIVQLFPVMKRWMDGLEQIENDTDNETREAVEQIQDLKTHRDRIRKVNRRRLSRIVKHIAAKPHHLFLPYFFVFHVVTLNFVLGFFIAATAVRGDEASLLAHLPHIRTVAFACIPLAALISLVFFVSYFMRNRTPVWCERLACLCLIVTILLCYSLCSPFVLIGLVIVQQFGANIIMTQYFEPSRPQPDGGAGLRDVGPAVRET